MLLIVECGRCVLLISSWNLLGVGGYSYLLEPLWWLGMITSEWIFSPFLLTSMGFSCSNSLGYALWKQRHKLDISCSNSWCHFYDSSNQLRIVT